MQRREFFVAAAATPIVGFSDFERDESDSSELPDSDDPMVWFGLLSVAVEAPVDEAEALEAAEWIRDDREIEEAIRRAARDEYDEDELIERFVATSDWVEYE
jgi:hypothetical protein